MYKTLRYIQIKLYNFNNLINTKTTFGENEKYGRNFPLDIEDIRSIVDIISNPDKVVFFKEGEGSNRNMFYFFKEAEDGTYNLMEIYSDRKGNLTAKSFYKSKEGVSQRAITLSKSLHTTSETDGATLNHRPVLDTGLAPVMYEVAEWSEIRKPQQNQSASSQENGQDLTTGSSIDIDAVSSAKVTINPYGAKQELNILVHKYMGQRKTRGFIGDLASALGDRTTKQTYYFEFKDKAGNTYTLRISNHNVNANNADENEKEISIVIK